MNENRVKAIDAIYAGILNIANNHEYGFMKYGMPWGRKGSKDYNETFLSFVQDLRRLAKVCGLSYHDGMYYYFNGRIYEQCGKEIVRTAYDMFIEYYHVVAMMGNNVAFQHYFLDTIKYYCELDIRNDIVAFSNGVLDLETLQFDAFSPRYHVTWYHNYPYNPKAKCPKWISFLHEVLPDKTDRSVLQMFLGLGLIQRGSIYNVGDVSVGAKVELCLILIGSGANGKSVIYQTATGLFGKSKISSVDYDELTAQGDEGMRARRMLRDCIFNWSSDSDAKTFGRKRSGIFKRIVSGEPILDRKLGEDIKQNCDMPYLIFNINELPKPDDSSLGFLRRLQFIAFDVTIPKERQNKRLAQELVSEYSGIFNWVVRGSREIRRKRFAFPSTNGQRRKAMLTQLYVDPVSAWKNVYNVRPTISYEDEECFRASSTFLTKCITEFCKENCVDPPSNIKIGYALRKLGFEKRHAASGSEYLLYGTTEQDLSFPVNIVDERTVDDYEEDVDSFIDYSD